MNTSLRKNRKLCARLRNLTIDPANMVTRITWVIRLGLLAAVLLTGGCSTRRYAVNTIGDVLVSEGSLYESDDDIVLIGEALPFSLKLVEGLLVESPHHRGLLLSAARGFVLYSYAYVHYEAEQLARDDVHRARALRAPGAAPVSPRRQIRAPGVGASLSRFCRAVVSATAHRCAEDRHACPRPGCAILVLDCRCTRAGDIGVKA